MAWYENWFDQDEYELLYQNRNASEATELADLVERTVKPEPGCSILDMGCGRGRHAIEFATRGYRLTGIDLSERSIAQAKSAALEAGLEIDFRRGDMRTPITDAVFDGILNLFTAFGYFNTHDEHQSALNAMLAPLTPGGWFVQDFLNAERVIADLVPEDVRTIGVASVRQNRWIENNRIRKKIVFSYEDQEHEFDESVALLRKEDFESMYALAGLTIFHVAGSYQGDPHSPSSPRLIMFSRKKID